MKIKDIMKILDGQLVVGEGHIENEVFAACGADLMSDVMAYVKDSVVLLTGLINTQVIRTADMMDIHVLVFVRGKMPTDEMLKLAEERNMVVLTTVHPMFVACGKLYSEGLTYGGTRELNG